MSIKQFNGTYSPIEDRIVIRFSTTDGNEFVLWLTRRVTVSLMDVLVKVADAQLSRVTPSSNPGQPVAASPVISEFRKEAIAHATQFSTPYQPAFRHPLGEQPVLVTGFNLNSAPQVCGIEFKLLSNQSLNMNLPTVTVYQFYLLLKKLQEQAFWTANAAMTTGSSERDTAGQTTETTTTQAVRPPGKLLH